mmetsp:Transcript_7302/g.12326  ORF Transcript_7302/g.12326 Transcript_7302/m.12326 type:complete len:209 (+) Transcript_7302:5274-5900(+)
MAAQHLVALLESVDVQYKFSSMFNSELSLRFSLWKQGFQSELPHLPGLLDLEEQSLKAFLRILFIQYFNGREEKGRQIKLSDGAAQDVFELASKVLRDYMLKHSQLASINASKQTSGAPTKAPSQEQRQELAKQELHETELENQLKHLGPVVHEVVLENLLELSEVDLRVQLKALGQLVIDLTLCQDQQVREKSHKLVSRMFELLQQK